MYVSIENVALHLLTWQFVVVVIN